tara:strand:- start:349 stop:1041 length:693 start_codon:yes stop_codon:yes gene_type:complete
MKVAINQSNYISWKGYFDMIQTVDLFILYDDVQYTKRDWRNRNKIKTSQGLKWLTIPVNVKGKYFQKIKDTTISDKDWNTKHLGILKNAYAKSEHFQEIFPFLENLYLTCEYERISDINFHFISGICDFLNIKTKLVFSSIYNLSRLEKTDKLIDICIQAGAKEYVSGPLAKDYIDKDLFDKANIKLTWMSYDNYPKYSQTYDEFEHKVSIIDVLFNCGEKSIKYITKEK